MAKKLENRTFNVSIIGLSGTEKEKGPTGVGKSCLCNRFMRPMADDYYTDHISVLSQSDFGGRVVNNDHFLYWGENVITSDEGVDFTYHIIEQTEFIDDSTFQPFKSGKTEPYYKRCLTVKLQSAEKLMYICKNQLGLEHEFEQKILAEGRITIDGFLCLFDVSVIPQRTIDRQVEYVALLLSSLVKMKKPVVLVTTKSDEANESYIKEAEKLVNRKEFKGSVPIVETSAHNNINVELAFLTLAHLIDRTKGRPKIVSYQEAAKARKEVLDVATEAYQNLIKCQVTDYKALWIPVHRRLQCDENYKHYVYLYGTEQARKLFRRHVMLLKEEFIQRKQEIYVDRLKGILHLILPDLMTIADRSWPSTLRWILRQDFFDQYFVTIPDDLQWRDSDIVESADERIPFDLLDCNEAEEVYREHVRVFRVENRRQQLQKQFKELLEDNHNVGAGQTLEDVSIFFLGRECYTVLSEDDKQKVYEQHQRELKDRARRDFQELLLENADLFTRFDPHGKITTDDLREINERIQNELRYIALNQLEEDRKVLLLNHLGFIQCPSKERCPFRELCMENLIDQVLAKKAHRPQSWSRNSQFALDSEDSRLNLVILGSEHLANQLAHEIRLQCVDDEYTLEKEIFSLDYRPIDGDVSLPQNSFKTADFMPHGCFCVYNSITTLEYIRESLEKTLMSDLQREDRLPFQGLPIVIVLAHEPALTEKGLMVLREDGQNLADRLQCPFIDIPSSMMIDDSKRFHEDQIGLAMHRMVQSIKHRSSFVNPWQIAESIEPDIRILMCFMCGDDFSVELPLAPLLNHQCCYVTSDKYPTITLETYLDDSKRKVEVTVVSYHGASVVKDELYHGYILVYSAKRKASLASLCAFAYNIPVVPTKILAVTESGGANAFFSNEYTQTLITDGNALADRMNASFMTTCPNFQTQTASYTPFFKEAWDRKMETESSFTFSGDDSFQQIGGEPSESMLDRYSKRPSAVLPPRPPKRMESFGVGKSSTSNSQSTEDSEPVYDQPHLDCCHSDCSDGDRASSASPPFCDTSPYNTIGGDEVYSEISPRDTEHLIKPPSHVKSRRSMYAGWTMNSTFNRIGKKLTKSSTLPSSARLPGAACGQQSGWVEGTMYDPTTPLLSQPDWSEGYHGDMDKRSPPPTMPKPKPALKPKPLDLRRYGEVCQVLNRNIQESSQAYNLVKAPLATPEPIEIGDLYAQVRDAVSPPENDYALVHDALPAGKLHRIRSTFRKKEDKGGGTDSDSEFSSLEREKKKEDIYSRVNRRPTPHKKKYKPRHSGGSMPPPLPPYAEEKHLLVHTDQLEKVRSNSPSEGSEGTGDESHTTKKPKKRRSFRTKKKKHAEHELPMVISPPWSDSDLNTSLISKLSVDDEGGPYEPFTPRDCNSPGRYAEEGDDLLDSGYWKRRLKLRSEKDPDKLRRKEEKKAKEDERRKMKEEEKRLKEQQKLQRKMKKKDSKMSTPSQSSLGALEDMVQSDDNLVPYFVEKCITFIEDEGLTAEGIYRVPGNKAHVDLLVEKFKEDPQVDIHELDIPVNAVATALKGFFSDLAEPLIPNSVYDELITAAGTRDPSSRVLALREVLRKMPATNFEVLKFLITHIRRVTKHSAENSMDSRNLSICWWPTLLRPEFSSFEKMALASKDLEEIIYQQIEQYGFFFYGEDEV